MFTWAKTAGAAAGSPWLYLDNLARGVMDETCVGTARLIIHSKLVPFQNVLISVIVGLYLQPDQDWRRVCRACMHPLYAGRQPRYRFVNRFALKAMSSFLVVRL